MSWRSGFCSMKVICPRFWNWGLLEKSRAGLLTPQDEEVWQRYESLEHLVRMAKAKAHVKLIRPV